jgi:hypothetical protein
MNIREKYKQILHQIEEICDEINLTQSDNLLKIIKMTKLKDKFNCIDFFDNFKPNNDKPYSILNTDRESDPGNGIHWVGVYQYDNFLYIYDTFARKHIMDRFCDEMNEFGYRCFYVNKKRDQQNKQINCGLRSLLWLLFVQRYGIKQASKI